MPLTHETDLRLKTEHGTVVIQGKTAVPFQSLVTLILQRNVFSLFKDWGREPVVVSSELLTNLASASQDAQENRSHLIIVTLGIGIIAGIFCMATLQIILSTLGLTLQSRELFLIAGGIVGLAFLTSLLARIKKGKRGEKIEEKMEKIAGLFGK